MTDGQIAQNIIVGVGILFASWQAYRIGRIKHGTSVVRRMRAEIRVKNDSEAAVLCKVLDIMHEEI